MPTPSTAKWPKPRNEDEFEDIVVDFLRLRWRDPNAQRFGRRGQRQHGVDVIGRPPRLHGASAGAQAKNVEAISVVDVVAEVKKARTFPGGLNEFYIVTSCDRDTRLLAAVKARLSKNRAPFVVEVVFWDDIVSEISAHETLVAKHWKGFVTSDMRTPVTQFESEVRRIEERFTESAEDRRRSTIDAHRLQEFFRLRNAYGDLIAQATQLSIFVQAHMHVFGLPPKNKMRDAFYEMALVLEDGLYPIASRISLLDANEERQDEVGDLCNTFRDVCAEGQFYGQILSEKEQQHWIDLISGAVERACRQIGESLNAEEARCFFASRSVGPP